MNLEEAQSLVGKLLNCKNAIGTSDITGILTFVGKNEMLDWELQATIGRMPIILRSLDQLSEYTGDYRYSEQ